MPITTDSLLLADFVRTVDGQRILDLGTGSGIIALSLCAKAKVSVTGIDINEQAIQEARSQLDRERLLLKGSATFLHGDVRDAAFIQGLGAFDQVVCQCLELGSANRHLQMLRTILIGRDERQVDVRLSG